LIAQRDAAFQALRELNFDHRVGKITDEDFVAFEANLKRHAADTLRVLDQWEAEADDELDQAMEKAIRARKAALARAGVSAVAGVGGANSRPCPQCGKAALAGDKFCASCGAALPGAAAPVVASRPTRACPNCGQAYEAGDKFCARCGQTLTVEPVPGGALSS
jgi:predicted nucleic acid-binding Zn ribbon protein